MINQSSQNLIKHQTGNEKIAVSSSPLLGELEPRQLLSSIANQKVSQVLQLGEEAGMGLQALGSYTLNVLVYNANERLLNEGNCKVKNLQPFNQSLMYEVGSLIIKSINMLENVVFDPLQICNTQQFKQANGYNRNQGMLVSAMERYETMIKEEQSMGLSKLILLTELAKNLHLEFQCPVILYSEPYYSGESLALPIGKMPDLYGGHFPPQWGVVPWNSNARSIHVTKGFMSTLCNAPHFKGIHFDIAESCEDLEYVVPSMNNNIQSIAVAKQKKMLYTQPQKN